MDKKETITVFDPDTGVTLDIPTANTNMADTTFDYDLFGNPTTYQFPSTVDIGSIGMNSTTTVPIYSDPVEQRLTAIEDRLAILDEPDATKLEQFEALKNAYKQYKLLEKICYGDTNGNS